MSPSNIDLRHPLKKKVNTLKANQIESDTYSEEGSINDLEKHQKFKINVTHSTRKLHDTSNQPNTSTKPNQQSQNGKY